MMGSNDKPQDELFYAFNLDEIVPQDHLLRDIDRVLDLSDLLEHLAPYYSHTGRPSVDPELMIRMLCRLVHPDSPMPRRYLLVRPDRRQMVDGPGGLVLVVSQQRDVRRLHRPGASRRRPGGDRRHRTPRDRHAHRPRLPDAHRLPGGAGLV